MHYKSIHYEKHSKYDENYTETIAILFTKKNVNIVINSESH
jgi:hypothetical protein